MIRYYHVLVASIGSVTLMIVLPIGTPEFTFIDSLHISTFDFHIWCYDLKLELRLHLGKDLRES